ncbi:MAG TPA: PilZ domain-containing protein [Candidatus Acidoferrum sp.]|nr:PilZ domain-containing protein [Candidatus Acidoferrum sp.]
MPPEGVRRSSRIPKEIAILLTGSDIEGKVFSEQTKTVLLSRHGAGIVSRYKLSAEQELILRRLDTNKETEVRLVGQIGAEGEVYTYGVAFLDSTNNFWGIQFPTPSEEEQKTRVVLMECGSCQTRETVEQSDLESDVYRVNEGIVRFCKNCGSSTFWKRGSEDVTAVPAVVEMVQSRSMGWVDEEEQVPALAPVAVAAPAEPEPAARRENRRKHVRTKVTFQACVRSFAHGDDIVTCEDVSRGGLCFKSRKPYVEKFKIEVAAPYTPGMQNFFTPAEIVHVEELKDQKKFRCGVAYLKGAKHR